MPVHEEIYRVVTGRAPTPPTRYRGLRTVAPGHEQEPGLSGRDGRRPGRVTDLASLDEIQRRVLWLAVRMVDHANRERPPGEIKVGGHQASSASMVGIMTALWFGHLGGDDKVAVKPHASPVYHAIKYLTGELDRSYLTRLRALGGLQSYPSRTKDPDVVRLLDRLGRARRRRPAVRRRHPPLPRGARNGPLAAPARFIALAGDAELDEGNVWEAITDPALQGLGNVMLGRRHQPPEPRPRRPGPEDQEADGVLRRRRLARRRGEVRRAVCTAAFEPPRAATRCARTSTRCRTRSTSRCSPTAAPSCGSASCAGADAAVRGVARRRTPTTTSRRSCRTSAATTSACCSTAYRACDDVADRPSVVFAYTVKGWGLPIAGDPLNHSAAAVGRADRRAADVARADAGRRVGSLRPGVAGRVERARRPAAS